jgi:hypothetical protein
VTWARAPQPTREQRLRARQKRMAAQVVRARASTMSGTTTGPHPKEEALESAAYERAVRDLGYCMRCGWRGRPQFCHRDQGKGAGIKTDVREGWPGCASCHGALGGHTGAARLPKEVRRAEELHLGFLTRRAVRAAGTWPKSVPDWEE